MDYTISYNKALWYGLIIFYAVYFVAGIYQPGSSVGKFALFVYIGISVIYAIKTIFLAKVTLFARLWLILLALNVAGFVIAPEINIQLAHTNYFSTLRTIVLVSVTFYPFYFLARKNIIDRKEMIILFAMLLGIFFLNYLLERESLHLEGLDTEQVNAVYGLVYLLPFVFFLKRKVFVYAVVAILFVVVLSSIKRGAFITFCVGSVVALYWIGFRASRARFLRPMRSVQNKDLQFSFLRANIRHTPLRIIGGLAVLSLCILLGYNLTTGNELLMGRFEGLANDSGSGRGDRYFPPLISAWVDAPSLFNQIFGYGYAGTFYIIGIAAHNDFLEMLVNFGVVGALIYVGLWVALFADYKKHIYDLSQRYALLTILLMWILDSQYQQWYNSLYTSASVMVLGYILGKASYYKQSLNQPNRLVHG